MDNRHPVEYKFPFKIEEQGYIMFNNKVVKARVLTIELKVLGRETNLTYYVSHEHGQSKVNYTDMYKTKEDLIASL
jgi:hypothetical protein